MLMRGPEGTLVPADPQAAQWIAKWNYGEGVRAIVSRARNIGFHRKFFAMLNVAFDAWEPETPEYAGQVALKNFERFRKDLVVLAGFYLPTVNLRGEVRLEPESISFASMDEDRFNQVYSAVADVVLQRVLRNYTREDLDRVVDEIMGFT